MERRLIYVWIHAAFSISINYFYCCAMCLLSYRKHLEMLLVPKLKSPPLCPELLLQFSSVLPVPRQCCARSLILVCLQCEITVLLAEGEVVPEDLHCKDLPASASTIVWDLCFLHLSCCFLIFFQSVIKSLVILGVWACVWLKEANPDSSTKMAIST